MDFGFPKSGQEWVAQEATKTLPAILPMKSPPSCLHSAHLASSLSLSR